MTNAGEYFELARTEERDGNEGAALLLYLSSLSAGFNSDVRSCPVGTVSKIRKMQMQLSLSDFQLLSLIHSYGPLTVRECQKLLYFSIRGDISGIKTTLAGSACGN